MDCNCRFYGEVYTLAKEEKIVPSSDSKQESKINGKDTPELRVDLINEVVDKLENILIKWQEDNNVSIWELDNVLMRLHYDIEGNKHMLMHSGEDKPNVEFKGSTHLYS